MFNYWDAALQQLHLLTALNRTDNVGGLAVILMQSLADNLAKLPSVYIRGFYDKWVGTNGFFQDIATEKLNPAALMAHRVWLPSNSCKKVLAKNLFISWLENHDKVRPSDEEIHQRQSSKGRHHTQSVPEHQEPP